MYTVLNTCLAGHLKWKDDLLKKASEAFWRRQQDTPNLRKLVYGNGITCSSLNMVVQFVNRERIRILQFLTFVFSRNLEAGEDSDDEKDEVGGLFKVAKNSSRESREKKILQSARDCSIFHVGNIDDWESDVNEVF